MLNIAREKCKETQHTNFNFGFAFSGFGDVLMSGFRALSEQYPMAQNYSPFKYVTLIFEVIAELLFARNDCYDLSFKS